MGNDSMYIENPKFLTNVASEEQQQQQQQQQHPAIVGHGRRQSSLLLSDRLHRYLLKDP